VLVAALDTSTLTLSCALVDLFPGGKPEVRCERTEHAPPKGKGGGAPVGHGARLPGALADLLTAEGLTLSDVEGYAIGIGPGSFTGLRIGLATFKGLAYANRRPVAGASSLAAMALAAAADAPLEALLLPLLDAKKGEVYAGFYRAVAGGVEALAKEAALLPEGLLSFARTLPGQPFAFGEGFLAYRPVLSGQLEELSTAAVAPQATAVAALCAPGLLGAVYDQQALFALEPHYVRKSEAEVKFPKGIGPGALK
jgi:tRNA threonylcarbamoyladenosine biosynthesis protein TsaB